MKSLRIIVIWALACLATLVLVSGAAVLSGIVLTQTRAVAIAQQALAVGSLSWQAHTNEDLFTDCAMLLMQLDRPPGAFRQAIDTKFRNSADHPCDTLRRTVYGSSEELKTLPPALSYSHYPYGPRHLEAFTLSIMSFGKARRLYYALSYGSLVLLFAAMLWRDRRTALILAPIPAVLALSFSLHLFGGNLAHAPGFFLCWLMLAAFVAAKPCFRTAERRAAFIAAISIVTIDFDLLSGVIPTILALTIVLNHFFYVRDDRGKMDYLKRAIFNGIAIAVSFLAAYLIVNLPRIYLLSALGVDTPTAYVDALLFRAGDDVGPFRVTFLMNLLALFNVRYQMAPGGEPIASWTILTGIVSWIGALVLLATRYTIEASVDVIVPAAAAIGVLAWYKAFPEHTHVHVPFMVRLLALPAAFGMAALAVTSLSVFVNAREINRCAVNP